MSLAIGPIAGGALVGSSLGWRWIFVINIPIGLLAVAVTLWVVPESKATILRRTDFLGQAMIMGLLGTLTYGIIEGGRSGWTSRSSSSASRRHRIAGRHARATRGATATSAPPA